MALSSFRDTKNRILIGLYRATHASMNQDYFQAEQIAKHAGIDAGIAFVNQALIALDDQSLVFRRELGQSNVIVHSLTAAGFERAEELLNEEIAFDDLPVPASDRLVSVRDNQLLVEEIRGEVRSLQVALSGANDSGGLSPADVEEAKREVAQLAQCFASDEVRLAWVRAQAKAALTWISKEAAGSVIGTAALALLALIGRFIGLY